MSLITINFKLEEKKAKVFLSVLQNVGNNTSNSTIRGVMQYLHQNIKKDIWAEGYTEILLLKLLTKQTGKPGIHKNSSLKNYVGLPNHIIVNVLPNWCNSILIKIAKEGQLGKPTKKITAAETLTAKKVSDLTKLIINALP